MADSLDQSQVNVTPSAAQAGGRYPHVVDLVLSSAWAIEPSKLRAIVNVVAHRAYRGELPREAIADAQESRRASSVGFYRAVGASFEPLQVDAASGRPPTDARNITAVMPIMGTIIPRASDMDESSGMFSLNRFRRDFAMLVNDPAISAIVLDIDSPGGSASLVQETGAEIRAARSKKTIAAVADVNAMSAAYWLFAQATPGHTYVTPSGMVGSVGVISSHEDWSKALEAMGIDVTLITSEKAPYKAEGNPYEPLGAEARAEFQRIVDSYHADFRRAVAAGRGVSVSQVDEQFGGGRVFRGADAVSRGMADHVGTLEDAVRAVASVPSDGRRGARAEEVTERTPQATAEQIDVHTLGARVAAAIAQGRD